MILFSVGCSSAYKHLKSADGDAADIDKFRPAYGVGVYKTSVDVTGRHLSGLLVIKKMPDSSFRVVFTSEMGLTFFDFQWPQVEGFKVNAVIKQLDKKSVITTLRKDFELILMNRLNAAYAYQRKSDSLLYYVFRKQKEYYYYITDIPSVSLLRMERSSKKKPVVTAFMDRGLAGIPDTIGIRHERFEFNIGLKKIERDAKE